KDYADNSVEEVRASHILEHFPHAEIPAVIKEWVRVLKPGGRLKIAVPDFDMLARAYTNGLHDHLALESFIYGGQTKGDDFHKALFTKMRLEGLMMDAGLGEVRPWTSDISDAASLKISLNLEGTKLAKVESRPLPDPCEFLKDAKGVIHVGASSGQE